MVVAPLYLLVLGAAAALAGVYGLQLVAALGVVPNFETEVVVAAGIACVFIVTQSAYVIFIRFFFPSRDRGPLLCEMLSLAAALFFVPILLNVEIPGLPEKELPSAIEIFGRLDNLVYLTAFTLTHAFFKLMTLFSATRTQPTGRIGVLGWAGLCAAAVLGAQWCFLTWRAAEFSPNLAEATSIEVRTEQASGVIAQARRVSEGLSLTFDITGNTANDLIFRWAAPDGVGDLGDIFATAEVDGRIVSGAPFALDFSNNGWAEIRIPAKSMSEFARQCTVRWSGNSTKAWFSMLGFHAIPHNAPELLLAGPFSHAPAPNGAGSIVLIAIDGLGAHSLHLLGNPNEATPNLDAFASGAVLFEQAIAPAPAAEASCMTLLTALDPLDHGVLDVILGQPEAQSFQTLAGMLSQRGYATAAFTEGLDSRAGFGEGFELFDATIPKKGAGETLSKAGDWLEAHRRERQFLFVRLSELARPEPKMHYGQGFLPPRRNSASPQELYDTALLYLDRQLGTFFERIKGMTGMSRVCVAVAGTFGIDHESNPSLTEPWLRVPLIIDAPLQQPRRRTETVALRSVAPTLLEAVELDGTLNGTKVDASASMIKGAPDREVVSVMGDPLILSLRTGRWRFTWQSGLSPSTGRRVGRDAVLMFSDVHRYNQGGTERNYYRSESALARNYQERLEAYLEARFPEKSTPE